MKTTTRTLLIEKYISDDDDGLDDDAFLGMVADRIRDDLEASPRTVEQRVQDAKILFDNITGSSYYGFGFRQVLIVDEEAREAARVLVDRLKYHGAKGLE